MLRGNDDKFHDYENGNNADDNINLDTLTIIDVVVTIAPIKKNSTRHIIKI